MTRIGEYGDIGELTKVTEHGAATVPIGQRTRTYRLVSAGPGWEPAGSMARWTDGYWAVRFECDGVTHGRRSPHTEAGRQKATDLFNKWAGYA